MLQTEYLRSLNSNYERVLLDKKPEERKYQYCILSRGGIKGLLVCSLRYINGAAYLYYDISSKQNIAQIYDRHVINRKWMKDFIWSMRNIRLELSRFLLDEKNIIWYPQQIFQELENNIFSFLYVPYYEGDNGFHQLLEYFVEHIDYEDEVLVDCVYKMYEQFENAGEVYLQEQIFTDVKMLDGTADRKKEERVKMEEELEKTEEYRERRENKESREHKGNRENRENKESRERRENKESREYKGNRENIESREDKENRENIESREDKESRENRENIESREGKESRENRKNIENKEKMKAAEENGNEGEIAEESTRETKRVDRADKKSGGLLSFFDSRKKKETRNNYERELKLTMGGYEVAEDTQYEEEEWGRTIYIEEDSAPKERTHRLCTQDGRMIIQLDGNSITIGKKKGEADFVLEDLSVSRMHARIVKEQDGIYLEDLNSTNGTFKNGLRMHPYEKRKLEEGDEIRFGKREFIFY